MQCWTAIQSLVQKVACHRLIWLGAFSVMLLLVSACRGGEPSDAQIESAKATVATIRDTLYVPADATLLAEEPLYGTNPELKPGCVRAFVLMAYQAHRPFEQILAEYREALQTAGWEPSPYHSHDQNDYDIFIMGTQRFLEISDSPLRPDLLSVPTPAGVSEQPATTYYLQLSHYDPSILKCSGG
jgi:hypothetical protein